MLNKLHTITEKLPARPDIWLCEMLYKFISGDLDPITAEEYEFNKYSNPKATLDNMISKLYKEAIA